MINYQMTHRNYEATLGHQSWGIVFLKSSHKINFPFVVDPSIDRNILKEEYLFYIHILMFILVTSNYSMIKDRSHP